MKKITYFFASLLLISISFFSNFLNNQSYARGEWGNCKIINKPNITTDTKVINGLKIDTNGLASDDQRVYVYIRTNDEDVSIITANINVENSVINISEEFDKSGRNDEQSNHEQAFPEGDVQFFVLQNQIPSQPSNADEFRLLKDRTLCNESNDMRIYVNKSQTSSTFCKIILPNEEDLLPNKDIILKVDFNNEEFKGNNNKFDVDLTWAGGNRITWNAQNANGNPPRPDQSVEQLTTGLNLGKLSGDIRYTVSVSRLGFGLGGGERRDCNTTFETNPKGGYKGCQIDADCTEEGKICTTNSKGELGCSFIEDGFASNPCDNRNIKGQLDAKNNGNLWKSNYNCVTAFGTISTEPSAFIKSVLILILSLSGGILVLFLIINGYRLMTSQGDPDKIKEARESIISAIAGLLMIIFSIALLQLITVDILGIPGFR